MLDPKHEKECRDALKLECTCSAEDAPCARCIIFCDLGPELLQEIDELRHVIFEARPIVETMRDEVEEALLKVMNHIPSQPSVE